MDEKKKKNLRYFNSVFLDECDFYRLEKGQAKKKLALN
jgi:hypothetical protein